MLPFSVPHLPNSMSFVFLFIYINLIVILVSMKIKNWSGLKGFPKCILGNSSFYVFTIGKRQFSWALLLNRLTAFRNVKYWHSTSVACYPSKISVTLTPPFTHSYRDGRDHPVGQQSAATPVLCIGKPRQSGQRPRIEPATFQEWDVDHKHQLNVWMSCVPVCSPCWSWTLRDGWTDEELRRKRRERTGETEIV